ncbi:hypothetical protein Tco_0819326 [Tanacetum coccineum]|uniref:Uncharacterized protein n=1 Tax=Tanacetum coccineum TaxID=301880 RepID=A0ABQ5A8U2_9ASTR
MAWSARFLNRAIVFSFRSEDGSTVLFLDDQLKAFAVGGRGFTSNLEDDHGHTRLREHMKESESLLIIATEANDSSKSIQLPVDKPFATNRALFFKTFSNIHSNLIEKSI